MIGTSPTITFGTGPDSLVFQISEDAYANGDGTSDAKGDATFTVSADGKQIGGTFTAAASHATHQKQTVTLNGYFGPGTHSVSVKFLNDASGGTAATDRNLYVDAVNYKGANITWPDLFVSGIKGFTVTGGTSAPVDHFGRRIGLAFGPSHLATGRPMAVGSAGFCRRTRRSHLG